MSDKQVRDKHIGFFRQFKYYDFITLPLMILAVTGFSFLIGMYALNSIRKVSWVEFTSVILLVAIYLILGFIRNRMAINYYNDSRMRYRRTFEPEEIAMQRAKYIFLAAAFINLIIAIVLILTIK